MHLDGPINIAGRKVWALVMSHTDADWAKYRSQVTKMLTDAHVVVPEYFPPEYSDINANPIFGRAISQYRQVNALFDHVAQLCRDRHKDVWVVDAAHSLESLGFRMAVSAPQNVPTEALGLGSLNIV